MIIDILNNKHTKNFAIIFTNICTNIWKQIKYNYIFHSIAIHKCTPSDRKIYPRLGTPVLGYCKNEYYFLLLKASARELLGMTATSSPSERVFSHADKLYNVKCTNRGVRIFAILMTMIPHLGMNRTWIKVALV